MGALKQWAFAVCTAMVACGLAGMILPKSSMEKMFRTVVSIFFLCCILSPVVLGLPELLGGLDVEIDANALEQAQRLSDQAELQAVRQVEENLRKIVQENLSESGINVYALTINIETNGQSEAWLQSVLVEVDEEHRSSEGELTGRLRDLLGMDVQLGYR